jgi:hypothetical protein
MAPVDAWALAAGLASALSILGMLHPEFASEPLRVIVEHWRYWSHEFWTSIATYFQITMKPVLTALLVQER